MKSRVLAKNEVKEKVVKVCCDCMRRLTAPVATPILLTFEKSGKCEVCQHKTFTTTIWNITERQQYAAMLPN